MCHKSAIKRARRLVVLDMSLVHHNTKTGALPSAIEINGCVMNHCSIPVGGVCSASVSPTGRSLLILLGTAVGGIL